MTDDLAARAVEKLVKGGHHAAARISTDEIMAMASWMLAASERIAELDASVRANNDG